MISVAIRGWTSRFGAPDDWDPSKGECHVLHVRQERHDDMPVMLSAWKPSALELEILNKGGSVVLGVLGSGHPPVFLYASGEE